MSNSTNQSPKIIKQCSWCGSCDVRLDAYAVWDVNTQQWVLDNIYDHGFCSDCEGDSNVVDQPIEEPTS